MLIIMIVGIIVIAFLFAIFESPQDRRIRENHEAEKKYNHFRYKCPMCGSNDVKTISAVNKAASIATVGLISNKIGKNYECDKCKYRW